MRQFSVKVRATNESFYYVQLICKKLLLGHVDGNIYVSEGNKGKGMKEE